jgi:hypothetical protein
VSPLTLTGYKAGEMGRRSSMETQGAWQRQNFPQGLFVGSPELASVLPFKKPPATLRILSSAEQTADPDPGMTNHD